MKINEIMKYVLLGGIFGIFFVPFVVAYSQFFPFITGKGFVFRIAIEILFAIWIILAIRDRSYLPKFSWITGAVFIFTAVIALADIFGQNPYKSFWSNFERMEGLITIIHLALYYLVVTSMINTEKLWKIFLNISVGSSVIMCLFGFLQLAGKIVINQGGVRVDGTFGNATYLAVYVLVNMFFAVLLFVRSKENIYLRISYAIAFLMLGIILYETATRGAILGLIGGAILSALIVAIFAKGDKRARVVSLSTLALIIIIIGGFFAIRNTNFVKSSQTLGRFASLNSEGIKSQGRYFVWPMAIKGFKENPILGWGQENFSYVFNKNYDPRMYAQEQWFDRTHNVFLDWLVAGGLLGLSAYLFMYVALLFYLWRGKNSFSLVEKSIITGLIAGYVFQNIFVFDNLISYILFFAVLAFVHSRSVGEKEPIKWISKLTSNREIVEYVAVPVVVIALIFSMYFLNVKPILANRALIEAIDPGVSVTPEQSLNNFKKIFSYNTFGSSEAREQFLTVLNRFVAPTTPVATRNDFFDLVNKEMTNQLNRTPTDTRYLLFTGSMLMQIGQNKEALLYLEKASATSPNKQNIYFAIGSAYISIGPSEYPKALEVLKKAYELDPNYPEAKKIYAIGNVYVRNYKLAGELLSTIDPSQTAFDDRLLSAYFFAGNYDEVVRILKYRVEADPENTQYRFQLAATYFKIGNKTASIAELNKAAAIDPKLKTQTDFIIGEIKAGRNPLK